MRRFVVALWSVLLGACHRAAPAPIGADPTPPAKAAPQRSKPAVHDETFSAKGPPETKLAWPRIDLPHDAGVAISASLEADLRKEARDVDDLWREATADGGDPQVDGAPYTVESGCTPTLVAYDVVVVRCDHSSYTGGAHESAWVTTRAWTIAGAEARPFHALEVFGKDGLSALARVVIARLEAQGASFVVDKTIGVPELLKNDMLDSFVVDRDGLRFVFSPYAVASWAEGEPTVHLDWKGLRALAPETKLLATIEAAAHDPDAIVSPHEPDDPPSAP